MAANSQSSSNMSQRNEIVRTNTTQAAFSGALPVIGSGVALIANLIPGIRATRLDPADTLRAD